MANNTCLFVDSLVVSFLIGAVSLSAIQLVSPVINLVNLLYWMIGLGGSVLTAVAKAEYDEDKSNHLFSISLISLVILGLLITVLGLVFSDNIVGILCSTSELTPLVKSFFTTMLIGMPFLCYMMSLSYFMRVDGMAKIPLVAILISNVANVILDFVYISIFHMGIQGAALATVTGYILGSLFITIYFFRKERTLKLIAKTRIKFSERLYYLKEICVSGFPSASTQLFITLKLFCINIIISWILGKSGLIAFSVCNNISFIIYMFLIGTSQTMSPIVSVYNQEEDYAAVDFITKRSLKIVLLSSIIIAAVFILFPQVALTLFSISNPVDVATVSTALRLYSLSFIGLAVTFLVMFYAQAIKENSFALKISCLEGFTLPVLLSFVLIQFIGPNGIWIAFILSEVIAILYILFYSKRVEKESNGKISGIFMIKKQDDSNVLDYSVKADVKEIVDLSEKVRNRLIGKNIADLTSIRVSLAIEEMLMNIVTLNNNIDFIDVIVKIQDNHILISIKDEGIMFNPTVKRDNLDFDSISMLNKISDEVSYSRVLGLNSTVIKINK